MVFWPGEVNFGGHFGFRIVISSSDRGWRIGVLVWDLDLISGDNNKFLLGFHFIYLKCIIY